MPLEFLLMVAKEVFFSFSIASSSILFGEANPLTKNIKGRIAKVYLNTLENTRNTY